MTIISLGLVISILLVATVFGVEKFREYYVNDTVSTRIVLRCPLSWSDEDSILYYHLKDNGDIVPLLHQSESRDFFLLDVAPEARNSKYECEVTHKKDGSKEKVSYYIDRLGRSKDIQKLEYSIPSTTMRDMKIGDSLTLKCPGDGKESTYLWFGPDLLQLNSTIATLELVSLTKRDFGEYFCGRLDDLKGTTLTVSKFVVITQLFYYHADIKNAAQLLVYPTYKLGERIVYQPSTAYTLTRRLIWEYPPGTVLLNQGRDFIREIFTHDMTMEEFYFRETDRVDLTRFVAKKVLFQSQKMSLQSFTVDTSPQSSATVIIGNSIELFCNNSNNLKSVWYYKDPSNMIQQSLPEGVTTRVDGQFTIVQINSSTFKHSGIYVCDAKKGVAQVVLTVVPRPELTVSPKEVVIRPGSSARFLCQLIDGRGKVLWRRKDKKGFQLNVESRIGGDTQAILVIDVVPKELNGSVYECIHNGMVKEALLMVKDLCPSDKRACTSGDCIDETRFCNGITDCADKSDEDLAICAQCEPNQQACMDVDNKKPLQKCALKHWFCDGDNDCGNGYDELNCPKINKDTCLSTNFVCNDNQTLIPRSLWCDKTPNCPNGDDEFNCRPPEVVLPTKDTTYVVHRSSSISLVCEVVSVPTSTINWRFNWGILPQRLNYTVVQTGSDCNRIKNTLTIHNMHPDFAGVYTCEAVSSVRAMAKDYTIFVTTEILCKRPYFNNAASIKDMCLKCYCSNVTDDCNSASGYFQSSTPKVSTYSRAYLMNYLTKRILETGNSKSLYDPQSRIYKFYGDSYTTLVTNPNMYLTSHFGLAGSWLSSYSFYMIISFKLTGNQFDDIPGPAIVIKSSSGASLHWCRSDNSPVIYSTDTGFVNTLKLSLWEKEDWYNNIACSRTSSREDFMKVLTDVTDILLRIKYYTNQTGFEFHNITLEHAIPATKAGETGVLVPRVEMCNCPFPYSGLSCEKCVDGYKRNRKNQCIKMCPLNCEECNGDRECVKCKGARTGPQCLQCKKGYMRALDKNMVDNCVECSCEELLNITMIANECVRDLSSDGKIQCRCTGREINDGSCNQCLKRPLSVEDEKKCGNRTTTENPLCHKDGTDAIVNKNCKCKMGYKGDSCMECETGYFRFEGKCLKCFCSNATTQCQASSEYKFVNITMNSKDYRIDVKLTNRQLSGVYDIDNKDGDLKVNRSDNKIVVKRNPNQKGLIYVTLSVEDVANPDSINTYTMMYGGRMTFKFEYITDDLKSLLFTDVMPFLEIESKKFARIWAPFKYNEESKVMEVKFSEDCFPSWRYGPYGAIVSRELLLRALMTTQQISIGVPFNNDIVKKVRISEVTIEHARKQAGPGVVAPVEICPCPLDKSGVKCEACNKPGYQNVISLSPSMPDFVCGQCTGPSCDKCASGTYKYDFLLNKNFSSCQQGIEITTKGRVIRLNRGESLTIPCSVKSYKGGVGIHGWSKSGTDQLSTYRHLSDDGQSTVILNFEEIKLSDSGLYSCSAKNVFSNASEEFYIEVIDTAPRLKVDIFVMTETKKSIKFNASVSSPKSPTDYKVIWSVVKDGKVTTEESYKVNVITEGSQYKIDVEITTNVTSGTQLRGVVVGSRVTNPFFYEVRYNISRNISIDVGNVKISADKSILHLKFLEAGVVRVQTSPDIRIETFWYKVNENGTEIALPDGITSRGGDLTVWSASESHNGKYVGYVINTADGTKVGKVFTEVRVTSMCPDVGKEMFNVTRQTNVSIQLYVPMRNYCPNQTWELRKLSSGVVIDITKNVNRISEKEVVIDYPLGLGDVVRFRCFAIPDANLTGEIKISIESKYPIIEVMPKFETIYPVTLECIDKNIQYPSNITWYFNEKPIGNKSIIDWRVLGMFRPDIHEGTYTCFASNSFNNATKSLHMPETRSSLEPGTIKITSSTNPIEFENGTLKIYLIAGQRFQVNAVLVGFPPLGTEVKWFVDNKTITPTKTGKYFSSLEIGTTDVKEHCGTYKVQLLLPNGTTVTKTFDVVTHLRLQYFTKITGLNANGDLSILEGDNRMIICKLIRQENNLENEESNFKVDWKFVDVVGSLTMTSDIEGLKRTSDNRAIDITNARKLLNRYRGQCTATFNRMNYTSKFFTFDVNTRNIDPRVKLIGLTDNKYVDNEEGATSEVRCQAYDENSKRQLLNAEYKWEMTFNKGNIKMNWEKMLINDDKITFGGLVYHKLANSAIGRCRVNYFGIIAYSEDFLFRIKRKETNEVLPKIKIEVIFDSKRPPYPVAVSCRDPSVKVGTTLNITFAVSNPNFDRSSVTTKDGWLLINFTTNSTTFNPYKDSGLYTFTITNNFGNKSKQVLIPQYKNPNNNYSANIDIYSTTGIIENDRVRVKEGSELKLVCVYYGHPYPISLKWTLNKSVHSSPIIDSSDYWTSISISQFNTAYSAGEYKCDAQSHQGELTKKVLVEGYSFGIKVDILDEQGTVMGKQKSLAQGNNFVIRYRAIDLRTNKEVTTIPGSWEFRLSNKDNFTTIDNLTFTGEEIKYDGVQMMIYKIAHTGQIEIRCKFENKTETFVSEIVTLNVKETDTLHPEPHFYVVTDKAIYPIKLKCIDTNMEPSKVSLSKSVGYNNEKLIYTMKEKQMVITWDKFPFSPFFDLGTYKCNATNRYKTKTIFIDLPEQNDKILGTYVKFESRLNEIVIKNQNKSIDIVEGDKLMIICNFYGTRAPIIDVDIVFDSKSGEVQSPVTFATKFETKNYYSLLRIDKFNMSRHSGLYTCRSRNKTHPLSDTVFVQGIKPGVRVIVEGMDSENQWKLTMGSSRSFKCSAIDTVTKKLVDNVKYDWTLETVKGEAFNVDDLSEIVKKKDGNITLGTVKWNEDLRGRCEVTIKNGTFYSNYFEVTLLEDETKKPKLQFIEVPDKEDRGIPLLLRCIDERQEMSDITITRLSGVPTDVTFNKAKNSLDLIFPQTISNPMLHVGTYRCNATNKFGKDWKTTEISYKPKMKPLMVKIISKDSPIVAKLDKKTIEVLLSKKIELDCLYSGDMQPIDAKWFLIENGQVTQLEKSKPLNGYVVYQKTSDCLTLVKDGFSVKTSISLNCTARDSKGTMKTDSVVVNAISVGTKVVIIGLDNDTYISSKQGSDKVLSCKVIDLKTDMDLSKDFSLQFVFKNEKGQHLDLNQLSDRSIDSNGKLELTSLRNLKQTLMGHCVAKNATDNFMSSTFKYIVNEDDAKKPKLVFKEMFGENGIFPSKLECKDDNDKESDVTVSRGDRKPLPDELITKTKGSFVVTFPGNDPKLNSYEGQYNCMATNKYGSDQATLSIAIREKLTVTLNSTINKIMKDKSGNLYTYVRKNRKLELNCYVTGTPTPAIKFNIITEKYSPDLPVPARKIGLMPRDTQSPYQVEDKTEKHYRLTRLHYSQSPAASFNCEATSNGKTVSTEVKVIEVADIYKVNVISSPQNQLNLIAFLDKSFEIGCELVDGGSKLVTTKSIQWILKDQKDSVIDVNKLAKTVTKKDNKLIMDGISQDYGNLIRGRCSLYSNDTYDTLSDEFILNLRESPKITDIYMEVVAGNSKKIHPFPVNYTYDAKNTWEFKCVANTTGNVKPSITWIKCLNDICNSTTGAGSGDSLFFFERMTKFTDAGEYRCLVTLTLDLKLSSSATGIVYMTRKAAPKKSPSQSLSTKHTLILTCDNTDSSPEGNLTWIFTPKGQNVNAPLPPTADIKTNNQISKLTINKPVKPEYSGTYVCQVTNEYGTGGKTFNINIPSILLQRQRRM